MTEFDKLVLAERIAREYNIELFPQLRRRDGKYGSATCGCASTCRDGRVMVFVEDYENIDGDVISAEEFERTYEVVHLSFE